MERYIVLHLSQFRSPGCGALVARPAAAGQREKAAKVVDDSRQLGAVALVEGIVQGMQISLHQGFLDLIGDDGGPLHSHGQSEAEQRSFDATRRKLFRFLTGREISRGHNARSSAAATNRSRYHPAQGSTGDPHGQRKLAVPSAEAPPTKIRYVVAARRIRIPFSTTLDCSGTGLSRGTPGR